MVWLFKDMIDFGHECVQNTNWVGDVPLYSGECPPRNLRLFDATNQDNYWKHPDVWHDIKTAYDRFLKLNPYRTDVYKDYAWYADHGDQWEAFVELAKQVRPENYDSFSGKDFFDKMVKYAKAMVQYDKKHKVKTNKYNNCFTTNSNL